MADNHSGRVNKKHYADENHIIVIIIIIIRFYKRLIRCQYVVICQFININNVSSELLLKLNIYGAVDEWCTGDNVQPYVFCWYDRDNVV